MKSILPNDENYEEEVKDDWENEFEEAEEPSLTYALKEEKIIGKYDELEAVKQAVQKILNTERYEHEIYSWDYGVELKGFIGKDMEEVMFQVDTKIKEALMQDDRIEDVVAFEMEKISQHILHVSFKVISKKGDFESEVDISV